MSDRENTLKVNPQNHEPAVLSPELKNYLKIDYIVNKSYLSTLGDCAVVPCPAEMAKRAVSSSACFFPIKRMVYDQQENNLQKLANVYACASVAGIDLAMIIQSRAGEGIRIYLGACNEESRINGAQPKARILQNCFAGNFPGSSLGDEDCILDTEETEALIHQSMPSAYTAAGSVSGIASLRGQNVNEKNAAFYQGIEKVIEAMEGRDYTMVFLARALSPQELSGIRSELEGLYTKLSPFARSVFSVSQSSGDTVSQTLANALSESLTGTTSDSLSIGKSRTTTKGTNTFQSLNAGIGLNIGGKASPFSISPSVGKARGKGESSSHSESDSQTETEGFSLSKGNTTTITTSDGKTISFNSSQSIQLTYENKEVQEILAAIELQLKRLKTGTSLGMFAASAYFLAPTLLDVRIGASAYKAGISGDNTFVEHACVNTWNKEKAAEVMAYLRQLAHPEFSLNGLDGVTATPATVVSAPELAIHMNLPKTSVNNFPVRESVSFGRNIIAVNEERKGRKTMPLGRIYHLGREEAAGAGLDLESLTMHTFISGSTGAGKSNTVYGMLDALGRIKKDLHFLVIEPAKGEYKEAFAHRKDVFVYGVNPDLTPLLRINPFRFRKGVHILVHLNWLISIFNVCWPMEAAMPAILKQALERAYQSAGWDLKKSVNPVSLELFPDFTDVMREVERLLDESRYSDDNKGDYIGALCMRLQELTTGLNGMVFVSDDLTDEELFEQNVIIDLSQAGAPETKALLMGLMIIRLEEYWQIKKDSIQAPLKHLTVLEEAHHLLKRTSTEQSMDSANIAGKSVEMLNHALAQMRSAGEGFIIADQSPGLMDSSAIRNTNTKIVMRLPAYEDRELVGRAMGLNELQIVELAKLPTGVAAVYQNDWLEAVLVKIPYYPTEKQRYHFTPVDSVASADADRQSLLDALMHREGMEAMADRLGGSRIDAIARMNLSTQVKRHLMQYLTNQEEPKVERLGKLAYEFFNIREAAFGKDCHSLEEWKEGVLAQLKPSIEGYEPWEQETLLLLLASEYARRFKEFEPIYLHLVQQMM